jgi:hypothetical protein
MRVKERECRTARVDVEDGPPSCWVLDGPGGPLAGALRLKEKSCPESFTNPSLTIQFCHVFPISIGVGW